MRITRQVCIVIRCVSKVRKNKKGSSLDGNMASLHRGDYRIGKAWPWRQHEKKQTMQDLLFKTETKGVSNLIQRILSAIYIIFSINMFLNDENSDEKLISKKE